MIWNQACKIIELRGCRRGPALPKASSLGSRRRDASGSPTGGIGTCKTFVSFATPKRRSLARALLLLSAAYASHALAENDTGVSIDPACVKTRCFAPSCFYRYGEYFLRCPNGDHPLPGREQSQSSNEPKPESKPPAPSAQPVSRAALEQIAGDWELRLGASPRPLAVLRLRPDPGGALAGHLEQSFGASSQRVTLQGIQLKGTSITYMTPGGKEFRGTLSEDRQTIVGEDGSPTWTRVRTLSQALAEDANGH